MAQKFLLVSDVYFYDSEMYSSYGTLLIIIIMNIIIIIIIIIITTTTSTL
jgi:uncharacterized membrane protein